MFGRFGWAEILVIVVLVLILFGHNKIPGMMKNLADGINVFKKEIKNVNEADKKTAKSENKEVKAVKKSKTAKVVKKAVKKSANKK